MLARLSARDNLRAGRPVRPARLSLCLLTAAACAAGLTASSAQATPNTTALAASLASQSVSDFYAARNGQPLWLDADGTPGVAASMLLDYLRTASIDGLDPGKYLTPQLDQALAAAAWGGSPSKVRKADMQLSQAFIAYVRDLRQMGSADMIWVDPDLKPVPPSPSAVLEGAASAPSLERYLAGMRWMHPIYAGLRNIIARGDAGSAGPELLRLNLERARALPAGNGRFILVNATAQQLTMYENGAIVDSMKVVVGKPKNPTPMMAAYVRFAALNPYWYVPPDLAAERIAPNVLKEGLGYLKAQGYQVMSDWREDAAVIDPTTIDWKAVAEGTQEVRIRQLPGKYNAMGQMKFMFPNSQGVYLHDTPQKELLSEASRMFSGGCVRLEDAPRLGRWLFGAPLQAASKDPELRVDLPSPVPVYITYLTAVPNGRELAVYPDVYGRDHDRLAQLGSSIATGRQAISAATNLGTR